MGFFSQEYCSGYPFPFLGDLPEPRIKPGCPALQADSLPSELTQKCTPLKTLLKRHKEKEKESPYNKKCYSMEILKWGRKK